MQQRGPALLRVPNPALMCRVLCRPSWHSLVLLRHGRACQCIGLLRALVSLRLPPAVPALPCAHGTEDKRLLTLPCSFCRHAC